MHQTVNIYVCLEQQSYETVVEPVGLVVPHVEGVASLPPTLTALPHSPLHSYSKYLHLPLESISTEFGCACFEAGGSENQNAKMLNFYLWPDPDLTCDLVRKNKCV